MQFLQIRSHITMYHIVTVVCICTCLESILINNLFLGTFIQPATTVGSSSVCVGSSQTFNCTLEAFVEGIGFVIFSAIWSRNGSIITDSTPRHTLLRTQHGLQPVVTGLMIDNTTLDDDGAVYYCTADGAPDDFTSNVTLNVAGIYMLHNYLCTYVATYMLSLWYELVVMLMQL